MEVNFNHSSIILVYGSLMQMLKKKYCLMQNMVTGEEIMEETDQIRTK